MFSDFNEEIPQRGILNFVKMALGIFTPLLQTVYAISRFIVICYPQLVPKFCSKKASIFSVLVVFLLSVVISSHELFDDDFSIETRQEAKFSQYFFSSKTNQTTSELDSKGRSLVNVLILTVLSLIVFLCLIGTTKKTNDSLKKSILFLNSMGRNDMCKKRSAAYERVVNLNNSLLIISMLFTTCTLSETFIEELKFMRDEQLEYSFFHLQILNYIQLTISLMSCVVMVIYPIVCCLFVPSIHQSLKWLLNKLSFPR